MVGGERHGAGGGVGGFVLMSNWRRKSDKKEFKAYRLCQDKPIDVAGGMTVRGYMGDWIIDTDEGRVKYDSTIFYKEFEKVEDE